MQHLDHAGIDFAVWSDQGPLPWVVQCKGFKEQEALGPSQVRQVINSIEKFRNSDWTCQEYTLLHNRTGQNRESEAEIQGRLALLRAEITRIWDRQSFIRDTRKKIREVFLERMRTDASHLLKSQEGLFRFGSIYVPLAPVTEWRLKIKRDEPMQLLQISDDGVRQHLTELVLSPSTRSRWTLLTGHFEQARRPRGCMPPSWQHTT